jgi:hypothetical protein
MMTMMMWMVTMPTSPTWTATTMSRLVVVALATMVSFCDNLLHSWHVCHVIMSRKTKTLM